MSNETGCIFASATDIMRYLSTELLNSLEAEVRTILNSTADLQAIDTQALNTQPQAGKWSVLQILEHLNSYNRYYLTHIEQAIQHSRGKYVASDAFSSGLFGGYFTKMMYSQVKTAGKVVNKMQAPKDHRPPVSLEKERVLAEFLAGEQRLLQLLVEAKHLNMSRIKVPISISRWIKLSLGDTYGFLIAHQVRHFLQIANTLNAISSKTISSQAL